MLLHVLDLSPDTGRSPEDDFLKLNKELVKFNPELATRPQVVVLNKVDLIEARSKARDLLNFFDNRGIKIFEVSAATGAGCKELINYVGSELERIKREQGDKGDSREG